MSEDEAFIRKIVDSPGDDLPRLVYADWLDVCDDERGNYLRTELELVRNDDAGGLEALRRSLVTIADFDLVWAARISRPPAGVCCDHLRFINCGPRLADTDLMSFEATAKIQLPDAYRAFLLNYNAGQLVPGGLAPEPAEKFEGTPVLCFYPLLHSYSIPHDDIPKLDASGTYYSDRGFTVIGYNASELSLLLIGITDANAGELFSDCTIKPDMAFGGEPPWVAGNLSTFLASLSPRWEAARADRYDI